MKLSFYKYQATGNDFVLIDNRSGKMPAQAPTLYKKLCDRRFGIGGDGVLLLEQNPSYDFYMRYFNADGQLSSMCGNGGRCIVHWAYHHQVISQDTEFEAYDGVHRAQMEENDIIALEMQPVEDWELTGEACVMDTGSPHYITFVKDVSQLDVNEKGRQIRESDPYKSEGINVNFVQYREDDLYVRTYERGVEEETYSCGTGVVASALSAVIYGNVPLDSPITIQTRGGRLKVYYEKQNQSFKNIWLVGPAVNVYKGEIAL